MGPDGELIGNDFDWLEKQAGSRFKAPLVVGPA